MRRLEPLLVITLCVVPHLLRAQAPAPPPWAQPGSANHVQVAPPPDFHRPSKNAPATWLQRFRQSGEPCDPCPLRFPSQARM